jgi:hypothetical protein
VSALPVHEAAARSAAGEALVDGGVGWVAGDGEALMAAAVAVGLGGAETGPAVAVNVLRPGVVDGTAGDPHATATWPAMRRRMAGPTTRRVPARARVTG